MSYRDVYLKAARDIAKKHQEYSCISVGHYNALARRLYEDVFFDGSFRVSPLLISRACHVYRYNDPTQKMIDLRVMMLCMMAACCKDFEKDF